MQRIGKTFIVAALAAASLSTQAWGLCVASSFVSGDVQQLTTTTWMYSFFVQNACNTVEQQMLTDFYLPYFSDAGISQITVPDPDTKTTTSTITWSATVLPNDNLFGLPNAGVIDFHVTATPELQGDPAPGGDTFPQAPGVGYYGASGFSFVATFAGVEGPDAIQQVPWDDGRYDSSVLVFGDPPIPGSPLTIAALSSTPTPEPETIALLATGLIALGIPRAIRRRRITPSVRP